MPANSTEAYQIHSNIGDTAWDDFVRQHARAHILQLSAWAKLKAQHGWQHQRVVLTQGDTIVAGAQWLLRRLPLHLGMLAYLPYGGYVTQDDQWQPLWDAIRQEATQAGARLLKWEAGFYMESTPPAFGKWGFQPSPQRVQPPRTIMLDISADDDTILGRMNQGTRRKIRKSLKNSIHYYEAQTQDVAKFGDMMQTTGTRNEFGVHTAQYYQDAYDLFVPQDGALLLAEHEGDLLAGNFVFGAGDTAYYLYGASSNHKRNLMASYGIQWQGIQWAKARGYRYYDMWGVPDEDAETLEEQFQERNDGLWGVYGFKRGWGGDVVRSVGAWDLPYSPFIYQAYRLALKWRNRA
jgi:peptidoglycan pentaglycine glycine transferase (the first glycine)